MSAAKEALGLGKGEFGKKYSSIIDSHRIGTKLIGKPRDFILLACRLTESYSKMANDPTIEVRIKNVRIGPRKVKMAVLIRLSDKQEVPISKGKITDLLYPPRKTVNHAPPEKKHSQLVRSTMRRLVDYQLRNYRQTLKYPLTCFHTEQTIRIGMRMDIDHILKPFVQLCDEFVASNKLTYCDIAIYGPPNLKRFRDKKLQNAWILYHECNARLAPSLPKANRSAGSGTYEASEALIGTFEKADEEDLDLDF